MSILRIIVGVAALCFLTATQTQAQVAIIINNVPYLLVDSECQPVPGNLPPVGPTTRTGLENWFNGPVTVSFTKENATSPANAMYSVIIDGHGGEKLPPPPQELSGTKVKVWVECPCGTIVAAALIKIQ